MKKFALVTAILLLASTSFAQLDPDDDGIGVYFDPCACNNCISFDVGAHRAFLVITHPTSPQGVWGWEARLTFDGPMVLSAMTFTGESLNVGTPPDYVVGSVDPQVNPYTYPAIVVALIDFYIFNTDEPVHFYIDGTTRHSLDDRVPAYLDGADAMLIKPLQQATGGPDIAVATINGDCAVATDVETWGGVKALFR
jgi:hypothetical protein